MLENKLKLNLEKLSIKSFLTSLRHGDQSRLRGGTLELNSCIEGQSAVDCIPSTDRVSGFGNRG